MKTQNLVPLLVPLEPGRVSFAYLLSSARTVVVVSHQVSVPRACFGTRWMGRVRAFFFSSSELKGNYQSLLNPLSYPAFVVPAELQELLDSGDRFSSSISSM